MDRTPQTENKTRLERARLNRPSKIREGKPTSRHELVAEVNEWLRRERPHSSVRCSYRHVYRLETGITKQPHSPVREAICGVLDAAPEQLGFTPRKNIPRRRAGDKRTAPQTIPLPADVSLGCPTCTDHSRSHGHGEHAPPTPRPATAAVDIPHRLPIGFYLMPPVCCAVHHRDFGIVFDAVKRETGLKDSDLAEVTGLPAERIAKVIQRKQRISKIHHIVAIANALGIRAEQLGFRNAPALHAGRSLRGWAIKVDLTLQALAPIPPVADPGNRGLGLVALIPARTGHPRRFGMTQVIGIEHATAALRAEDYRGAGVSQARATSALREALVLGAGDCTDNVRAQWTIATSDLAKTAAWIAHDREDHDTAKRLWTVAADLASDTDHPRRAALLTDIHLAHAHAVLHYVGPDEAMKIVEQARDVARDRACSAGEVAHGYIEIVAAWCHGATGNTRATRAALGRGLDHYARADRVRAAPWEKFLLTDAELAAQQGHAFFQLAMTHPDYAETAIEHLTRATDGYGSDYRRFQEINSPNVARAWILYGEKESGIRAVRAATTVAAKTRSRRVASRLMALHGATAVYQSDSEVRRLRADLITTVTAIRDGAT